VAEGITEYYAALTVRRAGLSNPDDYLAALSEMIRMLQSTPGRHVQSLEQASWDAWIKLYRPDENTINTSVSYYVKGAVVAWLLDARIRRSTNGGRSLDDLMRLAFTRFSGARGFTPGEFKALASEIACAPLLDFFRRAVESTEELDYSEALDWFGLSFCRQIDDHRNDDHRNKDQGVIGLDTRVENGRLVVARVPRETPAWEAGLTADDEIIAIDDFRIRADQLAQRLENYRAGDRISLLIARRDVLKRVDLTLGNEPERWQLELLPGATEVQKRNFANWVGL
jgi:predicted metalloprotease with PDZ domain